MLEKRGSTWCNLITYFYISLICILKQFSLKFTVNQMVWSKRMAFHPILFIRWIRVTWCWRPSSASDRGSPLQPFTTVSGPILVLSIQWIRYYSSCFLFFFYERKLFLIYFCFLDLTRTICCAPFATDPRGPIQIPRFSILRSRVT